jgi:predicted small secreted protein
MNDLMKIHLKSIILLCCATAAIALISSGCGTVRGFGSDVEKAGENIEESAR